METAGTLYVGFDDSNHAGAKKGEIIVATFSYLYEDSIVRNFPNTRNSAEAQRWIRSPGRYMRYAILNDEESRSYGANLPLVAPFLVNDFLISQRMIPASIRLYFDGPIKKVHREILREDFLDRIPHVTAEGFIKKRFREEGFSKRPRCPTPVYIADILAHDYFHNFIDGNLNGLNLTELPRDEVVQRRMQLRAA